MKGLASKCSGYSCLYWCVYPKAGKRFEALSAVWSLGSEVPASSLS